MPCIRAEYIVVGGGLTGATIARGLRDAGREVVVLERRSATGGNVADAIHEGGIRYNLYGPHYFRTGSKSLWDYVRRFGSFIEYAPRLQTYVAGQHFSWPLHQEELTSLLDHGWETNHVSEDNFEAASLAMMPATLYRLFVHDYTEKQWGTAPKLLSSALARRIVVRSNGDTRLSTHPYQGIPAEGYSAWVAAMLANIPVYLDTPYIQGDPTYAAERTLIFTGPIDEYFGFRLGRLQYRGQQRQHLLIQNGFPQLPTVQVNYPSHESGALIRRIEWRHLPYREHDAISDDRSLITTETPYDPPNSSHYEYPFPDAANSALYDQYRMLASRLNGVLICGRLGEYRYFDMDQAIGRALQLVKALLAGDSRT